MPFRGHHIWCNGDPRIDPKKCKWCASDNGKLGLIKNYPEDELTPEELVRKHFPNVIPRPGTGPGTGESS
jgi:hypothetical protein